jgi:hypothetical protein
MDSIHYFTMEYVRGRPLSKVTETGPLEPLRAADLIARVAEALAAAHRAGVVHRDLKPANVMLDDAGLPVVVDFGLARRQEDLAQTRPGEVFGTPKFMSPEQINGQEVGPASDVYSLGATLYQLLTGRPPFEADTLAQLAYRIAHEPPEPPSRLRPGIDPGLEAICLKALAKAPAERFASMDAMATALQQYLSGVSTGQYVPPLPPAPNRRRLWPALAGLLLFGVMVVVITWIKITATGSQETPNPAALLTPFQGSMEVRVWEKENSTRHRLRLLDPLARPLRPGDLIQIEAKINRPGLLYVFWIHTDGKIDPVYPWKDFSWEVRPEYELPLDGLKLPEEKGNGLLVPKGNPGMETIVLLARDTPLPRDVEAQLRAAIGKLLLQNAKRPDDPILFQIPARVMENDRATRATVVMPINDPALQAEKLLQDAVKPFFTFCHMVSFGNRGE